MFLTGCPTNWNVCGTAELVPLLNAEATTFSCAESDPAVAVAVPVELRLSKDATLTGLLRVRFTAGDIADKLLVETPPFA